MKGGVIRPGTPDDLAAVAAIPLDAPSSWKPEEFLAHTLLVDEDAGQVIAFAAARQVAPGEWELLEIAVAAGSRRLGHGERLLGALLGDYPGDWYLEVRSSNLTAQALYQKLGFRAIGRRPHYYQNHARGNSEEGIVFHRQS